MKKATAAPSGAITPAVRASAVTSPSSSAPSGSAAQPGW